MNVGELRELLNRLPADLEILVGNEKHHGAIGMCATVSKQAGFLNPNNGFEKDKSEPSEHVLMILSLDAPQQGGEL